MRKRIVLGCLALTAAAIAGPLSNSSNASAVPVVTFTTVDCGNNISAVTPVIPPDTDLLSVPANMQDEIGIPHKPTDAKQLAIWTEFVTSKIYFPSDPCGALEELPSSATSANTTVNWSGLVDHNAPYTDAESNWYWPAAGSNTNSQFDSSSM